MTTIGEALDNNTLHREDQWGASAVTIGQALDRGWITEDMPAPAKPKPDKLDAAGIDPVSLVGGPENAKKIREAVTGYRGGDPGADPAEEWDRQDDAMRKVEEYVAENYTTDDVEAIVVPTPGAVHDAVNHPSHYTSHPSGIEAITVTEHMGFCLGNAMKYIWRADLKHDDGGLEDLRKARWYLDREITRREKAAA